MAHKDDSNYRREIILLTLAAFFGMLGYPFTRTSATPYFNAAYGSEYLSWAMIASALMAIITVVIYNKLAKRVALLPLCLATIIFITGITFGFAFAMGNHPPWMALLYYAWSDVYILIPVTQFWSIANTLLEKNIAKKYYGIFLTSGAVASLAGNGLVAKFAEPIGSDKMIFFCGLALLLFVACMFLLRKSIEKKRDMRDKFKLERNIAKSSTFGGASLVVKSQYLTLILLLVVASQLYVNGTYFIYNSYLDSATNVIDKQSALYAQIFFIIQIVAIFFSLVVTPITLRFLKTSGTHFFIVGLLITTFGAATLSPFFMLISILFIVAKGLDYSIFRAAREILYLPLSTAEKFQAKSFIDIFIYRLSKAIAALGIILVSQILGLSAFYLVGFGLISWFILIVLILRIYPKLQTYG